LLDSDLRHASLVLDKMRTRCRCAVKQQLNKLVKNGINVCDVVYCY